jgi:uncharacterized protein
VIDFATKSLKSRGALCHSMTDLSRPPISQPVLSTDSVVGTNATDLLPPTPKLTNGTSVDEEEEFTIKCICDYQDDDGNTVFCETCDTWQHIECYYEPENVPGKDDNHSCVDCEPRTLNAKLATERQREKRMGIDVEERKIKKPAKINKRRVKALDHQNGLNAWTDKLDLASPRNGTGTKDQSQAKRQKSGHKHSSSVHNSASVAKHPPPTSRRSASASHPLQSPSKQIDNPIHESTGEPYSPSFMHLYDEDPGESPNPKNLFNDIAITKMLASWSNDVDALEEATNGKGHKEVFMRSDCSVDAMSRPQIQKHVKEDLSREFHGRHPKWVYLTSDSDMFKESFVGELRGKIGHMKDYVQDEANRWEDLRHPLPFVFFHPALPIYIDTREEGTLVRYLRRSCQPNLVMKTILENGSDYRFCFMTTKEIEAGAELTIPWTTDEHVRAFTQQFGSGIKSEGFAETDENYILDYFSKVFADFGGCACEAPEECVINSLVRRLRAIHPEPPVSNGKTKRGRKPVNHATNSRTNASRSGSEAIRYQDEDDQDDAHSSSTSSRSKPQSRDITPSNQGDNKPTITGLEVSEREKRKIAAALERMDHDKNQPEKKKKKRTSGTSAVSNPVATSVSLKYLSR